MHRSGRISVSASLAVGVVVSLAASMAHADPGPSIDHRTLSSVPANRDVVIDANIVSNTKADVAIPRVYAHNAETTHFTSFMMARVPGTSDLFRATLPASFVTSDFDYYLEAFDKDDNGPSRQGDEQHPLHVHLEAAAPAPLVIEAAPPPPSTPNPPPPRDVPPLVVHDDSPPKVTLTQAPPAESSHTLSYVLWGGGGAAALGGVALLAVGAGDFAGWEASAFHVAGSAQGLTPAALSSAHQSADRAIGIGSALLVAGVVTAGIGAWQYLTAPAPSESSATPVASK